VKVSFAEEKLRGARLADVVNVRFGDAFTYLLDLDPGVDFEPTRRPV
jgi:hypothetical protein